MKEPVAIISSTIAPANSEHYGGLAAQYDPALRLEQTRGTVESLTALGVREIYLADNSGANWQDGMEEAVKPARVQVFSQHQYCNKGISELYLLLAALPQLPTDRPIIKLSGRYQLSRRLDTELGESDFVVREWHGLSLSRCSVSTVAYAVCNRAVYDRFLRETLRDMFGFAARIVGPQSLLRILHNSLFPTQDAYPYDDPPGTLEHAAWRALKKQGCRLQTVESLGVEGIAGQGGNRYYQ